MITIYNTTFLQSDFSVNNSCKSAVLEKKQAAAGFAVAVWQTIIIAFHRCNFYVSVFCQAVLRYYTDEAGKYITVWELTFLAISLRKSLVKMISRLLGEIVRGCHSKIHCANIPQRTELLWPKLLITSLSSAPYVSWQHASVRSCRWAPAVHK